MKITALLTLFSAMWIQALALAEPPPPAAVPGVNGGIKDPRSTMQPVILDHNQKGQRTDLPGQMLIFARWDIKPPNQIRGVEGSFTDEQILSGLRKFCREWRPPENDSTRPPLLLALQNWGCGAGLLEPLKALSAEFEIDVYQLYPVVTEIKPDPGHPAPNDKRLAEIIKAGQAR